MSPWELIRKGAEEIEILILNDGVSGAGKASRILGNRVELTSVRATSRKILSGWVVWLMSFTPQTSWISMEMKKSRV